MAHDANVWQCFLRFARFPPKPDHSQRDGCGLVAAPCGRSGHQECCGHSNSSTLGQLADALAMEEEEEPTGWQRVAGRCRSTWTFSRRCQSVTALLRSQAGPLAAEPCVCLPTSRLTRLDAPVFRTLLLRRLRLPLPVTVRACRCGLPLNAFGHHRSASAVG